MKNKLWLLVIALVLVADIQLFYLYARYSASNPEPIPEIGTTPTTQPVATATPTPTPNGPPLTLAELTSGLKQLYQKEVWDPPPGLKGRMRKILEDARPRLEPIETFEKTVPQHLAQPQLQFVMNSMGKLTLTTQDPLVATRLLTARAAEAPDDSHWTTSSSGFGNLIPPIPVPDLLAGLIAMDKDPKLRIKPEEAKDLLPLLQDLNSSSTYLEQLMLNLKNMLGSDIMTRIEGMRAQLQRGSPQESVNALLKVLKAND